MADPIVEDTQPRKPTNESRVPRLMSTTGTEQVASPQAHPTETGLGVLI